MEGFYTNKPLTCSQKKKLKKKQQQLQIDIEKDAVKSTDTSKSQEERALDIQLAIYGFRIYNIPGDGNCLYRSIAHQLDPKSTELHRELRVKAAKFILDHREEFSSYISDNICEYADKIANTNEWGGEIEIVALSRALNRNIFVHCVRYKEPICHGHTSAVGDDIHLVFYESAYLLGGHYNSVTKL
ncbi:Ubiquitin thioesterase otu2 [Babesia microti strain RI]|uniref:Ubiquitin thioesterase otu2 n=1 Tax=Babesia microti (strain RI) TaxID=1133968 RepID=A0A1N6LW85_BABMR|nr:Ubiquitin thioesterase otu2 [Babesia microti strain RI]SIO73133.1 Ubiquitin thioesterase otu2 [Babesia microti strain RI]|eukprot:XP_021337245.1 Ubiquitin thioesterase otu2 [Babesia microti strain RI]